MEIADLLISTRSSRLFPVGSLEGGTESAGVKGDLIVSPARVDPLTARFVEVGFVLSSPKPFTLSLSESPSYGGVQKISTVSPLPLSSFRVEPGSRIRCSLGVGCEGIESMFEGIGSIGEGGEGESK